MDSELQLSNSIAELSALSVVGVAIIVKFYCGVVCDVCLRVNRLPSFWREREYSCCYEHTVAFSQDGESNGEGLIYFNALCNIITKHV
jgi:hypothetical protein